MSTIIYRLMIFNYILFYLTPPIYYQINSNFLSVHKLSDTGFSLNGVSHYKY